MSLYARLRRREDIQIAIICALPREYDAIILAFDEIWNDDGGKLPLLSEYSALHKTGRIGGHDVVLALLPNMGTTTAASATATLRTIYTGLQLAVLTGICGGVPSPGTEKEILLGDVVISKSIVQYDLGRQHPDKFRRKDDTDNDLGRPNKNIRSLLAMFETRFNLHELQKRTIEILEQLQQKDIKTNHQVHYSRPVAGEDVLFEPDYTHRHRGQSGCSCSESSTCDGALNASCEELQCDVRRQVFRKRLQSSRKRRLGEEGNITTTKELQIHIGRVGSGNTVMKSGEHRDEIASENGLIAFEMEGAGVWDEIPCIIVKAVCDYADSHKNKTWQDFAAATAASTTKALLERYPKRDRPVTTHTSFLVPYNENPDFIGRSEILDQLKQQFGHDQQQTLTKRRSRIALYGLGGIGKTQIALAYVYSLKSVRPDMSIFWVHASNAQRFRQDYASIAEECNIHGREDPKVDILMLVKTWLERKEHGQWLMVIDNADDTHIFFQTQQGCSTDMSTDAIEACKLGRYIPQCGHGSVLITTRNRQAGSRLAPGRPLTKIERMTEDEAEQLLCSMLEGSGHVITTEETLLLSSRLEYLPLALAQAAAFIYENEISIAHYIQLLDESDSRFVDYLSKSFEAIGRDSDTPHAITATWIISFEQIQRDNTLAGDILSLISFFDRQAIPKEFISTYYIKKNTQDLEISPEAIVTEALGTLKAFCFITEGKDQSVDIHRLVQLVTRKWLLGKQRVTEFSRQALQIVSDAFPYGEHENQEACRKQLPHAYAVLEGAGAGLQDEDIWRASLLHCVASYLAYLGHWKEAEVKVAQGVALEIKVLGKEHPHTLSSIGNLASTYRNQGRWKDAEELDVQVVEISKKVLGEEHPDTLISIGNLASTYWNQGRWKDAEELEVQVVEIRKKVLGEEHPDTLISIGNLASIYRDQGRWKDAEELEVQVVEIRRKVLGEEHPDTLISIGNLALTYLNQGRWKDAEELDVQVVEISKKVLGEEHPDTLSSIGNLASIYRDQGRWKDAEELEVQVVEISKKVLGEEHPHTLISIGNLASTYRDQGRWKDAEELEVQVVEISKKVLGEEHPHTLSSIGNLASTYWNQGRWKDAEELEVQVVEISKKVLGEEHPDTLISISNLAFTLKSQGQKEEAIVLMRHCVRQRQHRLGLDHPDTASSLSALTKWEEEQGED
ncbi:hypothetical protein EsH8_II_001233 [Colletotrichum jinshuiense]